MAWTEADPKSWWWTHRDVELPEQRFEGDQLLFILLPPGEAAKLDMRDRREQRSPSSLKATNGTAK